MPQLFLLPSNHGTNVHKTALDIVAEVNALGMKNISEATVIAVGPPPILGFGKWRWLHHDACRIVPEILRSILHNRRRILLPQQASVRKSEKFIRSSVPMFRRKASR